MEAQSKSSRIASKQKELSRDLAAANLDAALEAQDAESFMKQLGEVIKAGGGYSAAARAAGLNRTALDTIASPEGYPALSTVVSRLSPLGLRLAIKTITHPSPNTDL